MKKIIGTTLAALMLAAISAGGMAAPAAAAPYHSMTPMHQMAKHHSKHWHQHLVCKTNWHHHKRVKLCFWVPNHR